MSTTCGRPSVLKDVGELGIVIGSLCGRDKITSAKDMLQDKLRRVCRINLRDVDLNELVIIAPGTILGNDKVPVDSVLGALDELVVVKLRLIIDSGFVASGSPASRPWL